MSNDRELLELAARAAGYQYLWNIDSLLIKGLEGHWNPLTDDGDALRLAVKLGMTVNIENDIETTCATAGWSSGRMLPDGVAAELHDGDPYAATRRAIVRAAAEIGRAAQ
jgi:hypothetical protein